MKEFVGDLETEDAFDCCVEEASSRLLMLSLRFARSLRAFATCRAFSIRLMRMSLSSSSVGLDAAFVGVVFANGLFCVYV
jgi:hypothetical protein